MKKWNERNYQRSETVLVGGLMALSGGYMDAYTYLYRDKVFANAQTGNMILFGINAAEGNLRTASRYLCPVLAFILGVFVAQSVRLHFQNKEKLHWRQISVFIEMLILCCVGFISTKYNLFANSLVSFACGIQVQSFRKIHGNSLATTMCIGNVRTATDLLCTYLHVRDKAVLHKSLLYYGVILIFISGAVLGNFGVKILGSQAVWACPVILFLAFLLMLWDKQE